MLCNSCGNLIELLNDSKESIICCGKEMVELNPNTFDATAEKHVPVVEQNGNSVKVLVGSIPHPMTEEHFIKYIFIMTTKKEIRFDLNHNDLPEVDFKLDDNEEIREVYAYCNLHGLWKN